MPYIKQGARERIEPQLKPLEQTELDAGELNYVVFRLGLAYLKRAGLKYLNLATLIGTLVCCVFELYRRVATPYEEEKIKQNGDVIR